jgi:hypothetical protein
LHRFVGVVGGHQLGVLVEASPLFGLSRPAMIRKTLDLPAPSGR